MNKNLYKEAGVDVEAGYESVNLIKELINKTKTPNVISDLGGFAGLFKLDIKNMDEPILVSGTDGVGTKLKIAFSLNKHNTIGIDCVAMCVNDILCNGATPLFFLDYIAIDKNIPEKVKEIVSGIANGCLTAGCSLIGGETAEMPGLYGKDEYDLAGFVVGVVDKKNILNKENVGCGDKIIGISSSGLHSNGFSLVRKIIEGLDLDEYVEELGTSLGKALLTPTKIYVKEILRLKDEVTIKGISHITGGGLYENIPRAIPSSLGARIYKDNIPLPPIFSYLIKAGNLVEDDMYGTFNMGLGMCVIVAEEEVKKSIDILNNQGLNAFLVGEVEDGYSGIKLC